MKKFMKLAAVLMAAAMLLALCACGNEPEADNNRTCIRLFRRNARGHCRITFYPVTAYFQCCKRT